MHSGARVTAKPPKMELPTADSRFAGNLEPVRLSMPPRSRVERTQHMQLKNLRPAMALALFVAAIASPMAAMSQKANLLVTAAISPRNVSMNGLVQLEARIQNDSKSKTVVLRGEPGWTREGGVAVRVTDALGNTRTIAPESGGLTALEAREGARKLSLKSGEGVSLTRQLMASELFPRPGTYSVVVTFQSPLPGSANRTVNPDELEGESGQSLPITVVVN